MGERKNENCLYDFGAIDRLGDDGRDFGHCLASDQSQDSTIRTETGSDHTQGTYRGREIVRDAVG